MKEYYNPTKIVFGENSIDYLDSFSNYSNVLVVTSAGAMKRDFTRKIQNQLPIESVNIISDIKSHPDLNDLIYLNSNLNLNKVDAIVAIGGGSVIDTAKFLSYSNSVPKELIINDAVKKNIEVNPEHIIPLIAIPTTSGTGSEVTPFATIWSRESGEKFSISSQYLYPYLAIVDPISTLELPLEQTTFSALDALSHAFESIWNKNCSEITYQYSVQAVKLLLANLSECLADRANIKLRSNLMKGSLFAGLAISNTRTAIAHSISYPLTSEFGMPHGLACSFTLIELININTKVNKPFMNKVAIDAGFESSRELELKMIELFDGIGVKKLVNKYIDSNKLNIKTKKILNNERASNNIIELSPFQVEEIIHRSLL